MSHSNSGINLPVGVTPELYDTYTELGVPLYDRMLIKSLAEQVSQRPQQELRCLDICTGTGQLLAKVAADPAFERVTFDAFDYFEDVLSIARTNIRASPVANRIRLRFADIHALPYADGEFHLIMGRSVVHHWADPAQAFREIWRVLAPGGACIIHEPRRDAAAEAIAQANAGRLSLGVRPFDLQEKYTSHEVKEQLKNAGVFTFKIFAPASGPESLGFELRIEKPLPSSLTNPQPGDRADGFRTGDIQ